MPQISAFVDYWLSGRGLVDKIPGSARDYFVPIGRHRTFLKKYNVLLAFYHGGLVGWAVKTYHDVLIHLLIAGTFRHRGIGSKMLELMSPKSVRSKTDQSAGDPSDFYRQNGYIKTPGPKLGKKHNIEIFSRGNSR